MQSPRPSHLIRPKTGPDDPELQETLSEGLAQIAPSDVAALAAELTDRRERLSSIVQSLARGETLPPEDCRSLAVAVTATSRQARLLQDMLPSSTVVTACARLLDERGPVEERVTRTVEALVPLERRLALELATGLLHLAAPRQYWLWTRWMWDLDHGTGILPLLASTTHASQAGDLGQRYRQLGALVALGAELGRKSGLVSPDLSDDPMLGPFATDAFLALAYSVYLYGITNWRLSREFNRLLPPVPILARRLLGLPRHSAAQP